MAIHPKQPKYPMSRNPGQCAEQNFNSLPDPAPSTPSDSESVIDRIKRRSYYCRFNEKRPKRTSTIVGTAAQREYYREMANKAKTRPDPSNGLHIDDEPCYSHGGSKSPTPINVRDPVHAHHPCQSAYLGSRDDADHNTANRTTPLIFTNDSSPSYLNHYHGTNRSQTPSHSRKSPFEGNETSRVKSSDYLNLRSAMTSPTFLAPTVHRSFAAASPSSVDYHTNGNCHRSFPLRNSVYDGISAAASIYGEWWRAIHFGCPKRVQSTPFFQLFRHVQSETSVDIVFGAVHHGGQQLKRFQFVGPSDEQQLLCHNRTTQAQSVRSAKCFVGGYQCIYAHLADSETNQFQCLHRSTVLALSSATRLQ